MREGEQSAKRKKRPDGRRWTVENCVRVSERLSLYVYDGPLPKLPIHDDSCRSLKWVDKADDTHTDTHTQAAACKCCVVQLNQAGSHHSHGSSGCQIETSI